MIKKCLSTLFVIAVSSYSASDGTLTITRVVELAVKQGTGTQLALNQVNQTKLGIKQAKSSFLPALNSSLSTSSNGALNSSSWSSPSTGANVELSYKFSPSSIPAYQASKIQSKATEYQYQQTINDVTTNAVESYISALYASKKINIAKNNLDYQKSKLQQIEEYRNAGTKSIADVLQQQTVVAEGEAAFLLAQQGYGRAILSIYNICGLPLTSQYQLDTTSLSRIVSNVMKDNTIAKEMDLNTVPQILSQQQVVSAAAYEMKSEQMKYLPSFTGAVGGGRSWNDVTSREGSTDPTGKVSFGVSYPIFDQFNRRQSVEKAILDLKAANLRLQELEKSVSLQHSQTVFDLEMAQKQLQVAETRLTAARQSLEATTQRYDAGASTLVEVAMVNSSYLNAENARLQAESSILTAYFNMLNQNGQISTFINNIFTLK